MGLLFEEANVAIGFVGLITDKADYIEMCFRDDKFGKISDIRHYETPATAAKDLNNKELNAICIDIFNVREAAGIEFITNIRQKYPTVPICLVGSSEQITNIEKNQAIPEEWKKRFSHYYKFKYDQKAADAKNNASTIIDLFIADIVKAMALKIYVTFDGKYQTPKPKKRLIDKDPVQAAMIGGACTILGVLIGKLF